MFRQTSSFGWNGRGSGWGCGCDCFALFADLVGTDKRTFTEPKVRSDRFVLDSYLRYDEQVYPSRYLVRICSELHTEKSRDLSVAVLG